MVFSGGRWPLCSANVAASASTLEQAVPFLTSGAVRIAGCIHRRFALRLSRVRGILTCHRAPPKKAMERNHQPAGRSVSAGIHRDHRAAGRGGALSWLVIPHLAVRQSAAREIAQPFRAAV